MTFDPLAIGFAVVFLVVFVMVGSRIFPEDMRLNPWRGDRPDDPSSHGVREDDDVRFNWDHHEPGDDDDR
jgi:hypothetical protein